MSSPFTFLPRRAAPGVDLEIVAAFWTSLSSKPVVRVVASFLKGLDAIGVEGPLPGAVAEAPTPLPIPEKTRPNSFLIPGSPVGPTI